MLLQIEKEEQNKFALFNLGFRPFFLLASVSAVILILLWTGVYSGYVVLSGYYHFIDWHSHEMLFAYAFAAIAGFLLTAVKNWTGISTIEGLPLAILTLVWIVARFLPFIDINPYIIAFTDLLFSLGVLVYVSIPIIKSKQKHNLLIIAVLFSIFFANILVHLQHLGLSQTLQMGNTIALYSIIMILVIISGRVVPFFTKIAVQYEQPKTNSLLEQLILIQLVLMLVAELFELPPLVFALISLLGAALHIFRIYPWLDRKIASIPILWVLYAGYSWIIIGFIAKAFSVYGLLLPSLAIHCWTIGAIALLSYGMMARVTLGHTGRNMIISSWISYGFVLLFLTAIVRIFLPLIFESYTMYWIQISALLWTLSFLFFIFVYGKMFIQPRVDGRKG